MFLNKSRILLLLIGAVVVAPVILAHLAHRYWQPEGRTNYGDLLPAEALPDPPLRLVSGEEFRLSALRGKWVMVQLDAGACGELCQHKLYVMRQVRAAHGRDRDRIERVWLVTDGVPPASAVKDAYQGTWMVNAAGSGLAERFPAPASPSEHIYLMDPLGNLMMRFPAGKDGGRGLEEARRLLRDTQRLLKYSQTG